MNTEKETESHIEFKTGARPTRNESDLSTKSLTPKEDKPWTALKKKLSGGLEEKQETDSELLGTDLPTTRPESINDTF